MSNLGVAYSVVYDMLGRRPVVIRGNCIRGKGGFDPEACSGMEPYEVTLGQVS